jgi:hypothetical protein
MGTIFRFTLPISINSKWNKKLKIDKEEWVKNNLRHLASNQSFF